MKILIEPQNKVEELLVKILCREENEEVHRLYHHIANFAQPLWASQNGIQHKLYETDLYYVDTVEGKTFLYTENEVFETTESLLCIEQSLKGNQFTRISKNCLINIDFAEMNASGVISDRENDSIKFLLADYFRKMHAKRSEQIIINPTTI